MIHKPTFKYMFMSHYATEVCKCPYLGLVYDVRAFAPKVAKAESFRICAYLVNVDCRCCLGYSSFPLMIDLYSLTERFSGMTSQLFWPLDMTIAFVRDFTSVSMRLARSVATSFILAAL